MKRSAPRVALLMLSLTACADTSALHQRHYGAQTSRYYAVGGARSDADLDAAAKLCDARFGVVQIGEATSDAYRQCMASQGWRYAYTTRDDAYPDPRHPGLVCHDIVVFGVVGSSCSNVGK